MNDIGKLIGQVDALLKRAAMHLEGDLDAEQIQLYDLALASAEVAGAQAALHAVGHATASERSMLQALADTFAAEVVSDTVQRLSVRLSAYGLNTADLPSGWRNTVAVWLAPSALTALGREVAACDGQLPQVGLSDEKRLIRLTFRQFATNVVMPRAEAVHRRNTMIPEEILEPLKAMGCFGLSVPERFGGLKPDDREDSLGMVVVTEELSRGSLGAAGSLITRPEIMARALLEGGTEAQKKHWLPRLASGEVLCAISVTEPGAGSDVSSVSLKATRVPGGWRLNGGKTWCTFAGKADAILVLARTDPEATPTYRGLSLFIVEKPATDAHEFDYAQEGGGKVSGRAIPTLGYRGMHSFEMFYDDFLVPDRALVGESAGEGRGFYYTMRGFMGGRLQTAARACGVMQAAFEAALTYARQRQVFSRPLADFPLTLAKFARMAAHISAGRHFTYQVATLMDEGRGEMEASLVKLLTCRAAEWVTREALQIHGGMGYAEEMAVSRYFADARVLSIFEGAEETLAIRVVGKALTGGRG